MVAQAFIFGGEGMPKTPQELARMRALVQSLRGRRRAPQNVGEGLQALGDGLVAGVTNWRANKAERTGREGANSAFQGVMSALMGGRKGAGASTSASTPGISTSGSIPASDLETDPVSRRINQGFAAFGDTNAPKNWESIREGIFAGESGGDYDALFGFSNREGGQFADTKLTDMTVDEALAFADPSGPYGQWVKGKVGRVATPMGAYQVVGTTLRGAKEGLGLRGDEKMTPELQEKIGQHIYRTQGTGAWEGYKGPMQPSGQYASLNPSLAPEQPAMDPKALLAQRLTKMQGGNVSANPEPMGQGSPQAQVVAALSGGQAAQQPAQQPQQVAQAAPQGVMNDPVSMQIMEALGNQYLQPGQRAILENALRQRMQAADPLRQIQLERERLELEQLRNPQLPDSVRALEERARRAGLEPGTSEYSEFMTSGGKSGVTVNVGQGSSEYNKALDKKLADQYIQIQDGAQSAQSKLAVLSGLDSALSQAGYTGAGAESVLAMKQAGRALGFDVGDLSNEETARALGNQLALQLRNPSGGAGMPGAMSDKDREFLVSSVPGLSKTPEGNRKLIDYMTRVEKRSIEVADMAQKYSEKNGQIDNGFFRELSQWSAQNPLFSEDDIARSAGKGEELETGATPQIQQMTIEQLGQLDTSTMSRQELDAAEARWNELMGQR